MLMGTFLRVQATTMSDEKKSGAKKEKGKKKYKCKKHKKRKHDVFINYRVATDKDLALKLFLSLSSEKRSDGKSYQPYLDVQCLNDGEDWEMGFLYGLQGAAVALLLISDDGLKRIEGANEHQDNVLLEFEKALEKMEHDEMIVLPLFVGKNVDGGLFKKFSNFPGSQYPDAKHASEKSTATCTVRETMNKLFKLQGIQVNPESYQDKLGDIKSKIEEALKKYNRLGDDVKDEETWQEKYTSDWTIQDVQRWLKDSGLGEYKDSFKEGAVDGKMLLDLTEDVLSSDLKVTKKLHLMRFKKEIEGFKAAEEEEEEDEEEDGGDEGGEGGGDEGGDEESLNI